ncbi:HR lysine demethylase and nuclear receptor corepressor, partial [Homo sapiens]
TQEAGHAACSLMLTQFVSSQEGINTENAPNSTTFLQWRHPQDQEHQRGDPRFR